MVHAFFRPPTPSRALGRYRWVRNEPLGRRAGKKLAASRKHKAQLLEASMAEEERRKAAIQQRRQQEAMAQVKEAREAAAAAAVRRELEAED